MKRLFLIALLICFPLTETASALSCPLRSQGPPCQEFWFADAVFIATAVEVLTVPYPQSDFAPYWQQFQKLTAKLKVEESFSGSVGSEIIFEMGDCYYPFKQGEKYLIYTNKGRDGKWHQRLGDSRTRPLSDAGEDLEYIRSLSKAPEGGRIFGKVINHSNVVTLRLNGEPSYLNTPMSGLKIIAENTKQSYETYTDALGNFEFLGLPEETYSVRALTAEHYTGKEAKVKLSNRGCAPLDFSIQASGAISGRVLDAANQSVSNVTVSIFSAEGVTDEILEKVKPYYVMRAVTDKQGVFRFFRLPAGGYFIAVNLVAKESESDGAAKVSGRVFYPGVKILSDAAVIRLNDGQEKQNADIKLPSP